MKIAGKPVPHESAGGHVSGEALYTDDLCRRFPRILHAWPVMAPHAHALLVRLGCDARAGGAGSLHGPHGRRMCRAKTTPVRSRHDEPLFPARSDVSLAAGGVGAGRDAGSGAARARLA